MKQNLATKEIEQRLKQEIERQQRNETLSAARLETETGDNLTVRNNCTALKRETEKLLGIQKINVGGHEVKRNLSEPGDQTLMHIDLIAEYLRTISRQIPSKAFRGLLTRGGVKSIGVDSRYTETYGPYEVMLI